MASSLIMMASNLEAMAFNLIAMASNLIAMASNLLAMACNLLAVASNLEARNRPVEKLLGSQCLLLRSRPLGPVRAEKQRRATLFCAATRHGFATRAVD